MLVGNITMVILFVSLTAMIILIVKDQIKEYKRIKNSKHKIYKYSNNYGYMNHELITIDKVEMNRDLPKNNNIYYSAALLYLNDCDYNPNYLFGAIILKWIKDGRMTKGQNNELYLSKSQSFENEFEKRLFLKLEEASHDSILEENELKKWVKNNYYAFYDLLMLLTNSEIKKLNDEDRIVAVISTFVMDDGIYDDSVKLLGLKKYLMNLSNIQDKRIEEINLWEEYLIYATLFGIAYEVDEQLKDHYPDISKYTKVEAFFGVFGVLLEMFLTSDD